MAHVYSIMDVYILGGCKQGLLGLSSTEAEMIALVEPIKGHKYVIKPLEESKILKGPWSLLCDNQAPVKIARDTGYSGRARTVELRSFTIQDFESRQVITLQF